MSSEEEYELRDLASTNKEDYNIDKYNKDHERFKALLASGVNVNAGSNPALLQAAGSPERDERFTLLLEHGADPNAAFEGLSALVKAAEGRAYNQVELLLKHPKYKLGNKSSGNRCNCTYEQIALSEACQDYNSLRSVELLVKEAKVDKTNSECRYHGSPLEGALLDAVGCDSKEEERFALLLEYGADPNAVGDRQSVMYKAANYRAYNQIELLLKHPKYKFGNKSPETECNCTDDEFLLSRACKDENMKIVEMLVKEAKFEIRNSECTTHGRALEQALLYVTGDSQRVERFALLLEYGADPNAVDENGKSVLWKAGDYRAFNQVEILLKHPKFKFGTKSPANACNCTDEEIILSMACYADNMKVVQVLMNEEKFKQTNFECTDHSRPLETKLIDAAGDSDQDETFALLLESGADPNAAYKNRKSILLLVVEARSMKQVELLLKFPKYKFGTKSPEYECNCTYEQIALSTACGDRDSVELVKLLVKEGKFDKFDFGCPNHRCPLNEATNICVEETFLLLLDKGADPNFRPYEDYCPPLITAIDMGVMFFVEELVKRGADLNATDRFGDSAVTRAAQRNDREDIFEYIVNAGGDINHENNHGVTALQFGAHRANLLVLEVALENGADINHKSKIGDTALIAAATQGHDEVVEILLEHGADKSIKNKARQTALRAAKKEGWAKVIALLE